MTWTDNIPGLKIESNDDGTITLEQDWCGEVDRVAIHRLHVRHLAEQLGMLQLITASDQNLAADLDRMRRNMLRIRDRAMRLQRDFAEHADWKHADLTDAMNAINALVDLFDMAVDDFADDYSASEPRTIPRVTETEPRGLCSPATPDAAGCVCDAVSHGTGAGQQQLELA